jgi:NAD(P)-dependent dehydrogenase (short-subunit alcohol dehydrogenase family)
VLDSAMPTIEATQLLRPDLLQGVSVVLAAAPVTLGASAPVGGAVGAACEELGANVCRCEIGAEEQASGESGLAGESPLQGAVAQALTDLDGIQVLVVDGASVFARVGGLGSGKDRAASGRSPAARQALRACLDASWNVTSAVANHAFLSNGCGGRIVYIAPPADAGEHADAARAGLENLARTLSIEWARHGITAVAIAPAAAGPTRSAAEVAREVAALTAYLASPAGAYFSGCLLDLRGPRGVEQRGV